MPLNILVVGATGGLGSALAREALRRGHSVSALVRSSEKLGEVLGAADASRLKAVHVGSASDPAVDVWEAPDATRLTLAAK
jgi:2-alkyl-3-oxoalkanoate reductase